MKTLKISCPPCSGTGVYCGFAEPPGVGVVCIKRAGSGETTFQYEPFARCGVSYEEFLKGKMP